MLTANQQMLAQIWPFTTGEPPVLLDWLPWSHTFGGNHNFNLVLPCRWHPLHRRRSSGAGVIDQTVANLRDVSPTTYFNVPTGFAALLPHLENDDDLRGEVLLRGCASCSTPRPPSRRPCGIGSMPWPGACSGTRLR